MGLYKDTNVPEELFQFAKEKYGKEGRDLIERAYTVSKEKHEGQFRLSGEPYIVHPLNVAYILSELSVDEKAISAALLHDVVEDTEYTKEEMISDFGLEIAGLVEGVTKISEIKSQSKETEAAENIRKMLLATAKDVRVILIKLSDKTHNLRTLKFQPEAKQIRIANEVLSIYAPIAGRLGIYKIKGELEDLSFQALHPKEYQDIKNRVKEKKHERDDYIEALQTILMQKLKEIHIDAKIEGRAKHFYSIYRKMVTKEKEFEEIFDLRALRIIADEVKDCYGVLGITHTLWTPVPGRFKDYIATPKSNLYQSLHTTVIGPDGRPIEVQIRTKEMNDVAEYGVAAHYSYKEGVKTDFSSAKWLEVLKNWQDTSLDAKEFLEDLKMDLHEDEVFVFTPKGEIISMPVGSTLLDFAFRIHTDIGLHSKGGKINGKMVPIRYELKSGDQVEIVTDKKVKPSPIWIRIAKTSSARQKIRAYLRKLQEDTYSDIESKSLGVNSVIALNEKEIEFLKKAKEKPLIQSKSKLDKKEAKVIVAGIHDVLVRLASCCSPIPGDKIIGFLTRGRGVSVHKKDCETAQKQLKESRTVSVRWDGMGEALPVQIEVRAKDKQGIYLSLVESISGTGTNIIEAGAHSISDGTLSAKFLLEVDHLDQLKEILDNFKLIKDVISAERIKKTT